MTPVFMILAGLLLLTVFAYGGHVQGRGERRYVASAARAFVLPWVLLSLGNFWVRWSAGAPAAPEALWLVAVMIVPIGAAFALWRQFRG